MNCSALEWLNQLIFMPLLSCYSVLLEMNYKCRNSNPASHRVFLEYEVVLAIHIWTFKSFPIGFW